MENKNIIINDFTSIAALNKSKWDHNSHYHNYLLKHLPVNCESALDIGCGTGEFSRLLSERFKLVEGIDLTPEMIKKAKEFSRGYKNIHYMVKDVMEQDLGENKYDCIASIATMHHLTMAEVLDKAKKALKPGGVLMILDLYKQETVGEKLSNILVVPANIIGRLMKTGKPRPTEEEIKAWEEHGKHDKYMSIREIEDITKEIIPGAKINRHFFWRYSLLWQKV